jgi:hypothetical protein
MVSPDARNSAWKCKYDLGIECEDFSFWAENDMLILMEQIRNGYVAVAILPEKDTNVPPIERAAGFISARCLRMKYIHNLLYPLWT